jgi:hypothetical protein
MTGDFGIPIVGQLAATKLPLDSGPLPDFCAG